MFHGGSKYLQFSYTIFDACGYFEKRGYKKHQKSDKHTYTPKSNTTE